MSFNSFNFNNFNSNVTEDVISNSFDYSNAIPTAENISYIIQFCDNVFNHFIKLIKEDEIKNERLKFEYRDYLYQEHYHQKFEITIRKGYEHTSFKNYSSFMNAVNSKQISNISSLEIKLNLSFFRGKKDNSIAHENEFRILFEPYNIKFDRKSNLKDNEMDQIEKKINELMKKLPIANTIFYSK